MDNVTSKKEKIVWYVSVLEVLKNVILTIFHIFSYAFIGIKASTYDLFVYLYNYASWRVDKAYKRTKEVLGTQGDNDDAKKKKEKVYNYSAKTLAKLEAEYQELIKDLQTTGATRS